MLGENNQDIIGALIEQVLQEVKQNSAGRSFKMEANAAELIRNLYQDILNEIVKVASLTHMTLHHDNKKKVNMDQEMKRLKMKLKGTTLSLEDIQTALLYSTSVTGQS